MMIMWIRLGAGMMFLVVLLGAFGAHALRGRISVEYLEVYKTAVLYQMVHALGLFVIAFLCKTNIDPKITWAGLLMVLGIILFSGSLYVLAITGIKWFGIITPFGGLCFLAAWLCLILTRFNIGG